MVATSSFEIGKKKNGKHAFYNCGKTRHVRSHCYKLMNDQIKRSTTNTQYNVAGFCRKCQGSDCWESCCLFHVLL